MSRKVTYTCDVCGDGKETKCLFAVRFKGNRSGDFELLRWPNNNFDHVRFYICFTCADSLMNKLYEEKQKVSGLP